ncbi:MAG TPA: hypothetical protein VFU81_08535 [Thermomicrobiales bacterium]|nr:hypothetical protein [Thermomicrobiales bacterium]
MSAGTQQTSRSGQSGTGVSNEVYDVITALSSKLEGLAAYQKYEKDGSPDLWRELRQQDEQSVRKLMRQLEQFAQQGKLRAA